MAKMTTTRGALPPRDPAASDTLTDDELVERYIVINPAFESAAMARTAWGPNVWSLIAFMRGEGNTVTQTAAAYNVPEIAIRAALAYYTRHREVIDARIVLHDAYFNEV